MQNTKLIAFRNKYINAAKQAAKGTAILPDTIIILAALESKYGQSELTKKENNFFGVKGSGATYKTKEFVNGKYITISQSFKKYSSPLESFKDFVKFISGPRYIKAGVLKAKTVPAQFKAIKAAGYATDPNYVSKLILLYNSIPKKVLIGAGALTLLAAGALIYYNNEKV